MQRYLAGLIAGVGGIMPALAKLGTSLLTDPAPTLPQPTILLGFAIWFGIGFFLSLCFNKAHEFDRALMLGLAAPAIITNGAAGIQKPPPDPPAAHVVSVPSTTGSLLSPFVGYQAHADNATPASSSPNLATPADAAPLIDEAFTSQQIQEFIGSHIDNGALVGLYLGNTGPSRTDVKPLSVTVTDGDKMFGSPELVYPGQPVVITAPLGATTLNLHTPAVSNESSSGYSTLKLWDGKHSQKYVVIYSPAKQVSPWTDFWWILGADRTVNLTPKVTVFRMINGGFYRTFGSSAPIP